MSEIVPFLFWLRFGSRNGPYKILGLFFLLSGFVKLLTYFTAQMGIYNMPAYHLLAFLEVAAVYIFYRMLANQKPNIWFIAAVFLVYCANTLIQNVVHTFNSNTWTLTSLIILYTGLAYFYRLYEFDVDDTPLEKRSDFIITAAWLIYASGSLFTYIMGTDILSGQPTGFFKNAWIFQCVSNIIKNVLISYGFYLNKYLCRRKLI